MNLAESMFAAMSSRSYSDRAAGGLREMMLGSDRALETAVSSVEAKNERREAIENAASVWEESIEDGRISDDEVAKLRAALDAAGMSATAAMLDEALADGEITEEERTQLGSGLEKEAGQLRSELSTQFEFALISYHTANSTNYMRLSSEASRASHTAEMAVINNMRA